MNAPDRLTVTLLLFAALLIPDPASALPQTGLPPSSLTLQCGVPGEFDSTRTLSALLPGRDALPATTVSFSAANGPATAVPEPSTWLLLGAGLTGLLGLMRRKRRR